MSQESSTLKAKLMLIIGSKKYQKWPQHAEAVLKFVFSAPAEEQEALMEELLLNFGRTDLPESDYFMGEMAFPNGYFDKIKEKLTLEDGVGSKAFALLEEKLPLNEFSKRFTILLKSLQNINEKSILLTLCFHEGILPYNYSTFDAGITQDIFDSVTKDDEEILKKILEIVNEEGQRYFQLIDRAMALLNLVNHGTPNEKTKAVRMTFAMMRGGKKLNTTVVINLSGCSSSEIIKDILKGTDPD